MEDVIAKLDLDSLAVLDEVHKTGSVSAAAERLGIAQSTASISLNRLRKVFGDKLFSRTAKGMEPTPFATAIVADVRAALGLLARAQSHSVQFDPAKARQRFHFAMTDIGELGLIPILLEDLQQRAPGVRLAVSIIGENTPRQLEDGAIDIAIGYMPQLEAGFHQRKVSTQRYVCVASKSHPRVQEKLSRRQFTDERHIHVRTAATGHGGIEAALLRHNLKRDVVIELPSFLTATRLAANTELLAVVPYIAAMTLAAREPLQILQLPVQLPEYDAMMYWHERFHDDPANVWFRRVLLEGLEKCGVLLQK